MSKWLIVSDNHTESNSVSIIRLSLIFDIDVEIDHQRLIKDNPDKNLIMYLNQMQISIILNSKRRSLYYQIVYR